MIKAFLILNIFLSQQYRQDPGINLYQLQFASLGSGTINMANYKGKHIIVVEFNAANPDRDELLSLDKLYRSDSSHLKIIAVPVKDFGGSPPLANLKALLKDTLALGYIVTDTGYAKKDAGNGQHQLLKWVTHKNENVHFDDDITAPGQIYIIGTTGTLYAILKKENVANSSLMQDIINNEPVNQ